MKKGDSLEEPFLSYQDAFAYKGRECLAGVSMQAGHGVL